ncbi:MAG: ribosome maturation factor RimP [Lachnospiraceae bacterium]|nr:ribosome maturation factor RimP [Lachnospiraceae bacterium]
MTKKEIEETCEQLVLPIIEQFGYELVDVEYVKEGPTYYLRVYADKQGGITIDDCVEISQLLSPKLDKYDKEFKDAYILEVSSPGLLRPLKKDKDFERNIGKVIEIKLFKAVEGAKNKEFTGKLASYDADSITIITDDNEELVIMRSNISLARLYIEF